MDEREREEGIMRGRVREEDEGKAGEEEKGR